jgi:hypothetical protein
LLLEPTRTNKLLYSEDYSQSSWSKVNTTATDNQIIAPNGSLTGGRVQRTSTDASYFLQALSESLSGYYYSTSIWVKKGNSDRVALRLQTNYPDRYDVRFVFSTESVELDQVYGDLTNGSYNVVKYPNDWYRIEITVKTASDNTQVRLQLSPRVSTGDTDSADTSSDAFCYIWGAQLETSGNTSSGYSTSYIPTSGSAVTRSADVCNGAQADFNDSEGVLFAEISALADDSSYRFISISDGTSSNRVFIGYRNASNSIYILAGTAAAFIPHKITDVTKIAIKYKSGDTSVFIDGFEVVSKTDTYTLSGLNELAFDSGTGSPFYGNSKQVMTFNEALSDTELENLTSWNSFREMATEQLYSIE